MNDRIHAGFAVLSATFVVAAFGIRYAVTPVRERGRHRGRRVQAVVTREVLDEWMGEWEPVYGAALAQKWKYCPACDRDEPSVLHKDGWRCGHCFETTSAEAAS